MAEGKRKRRSKAEMEAARAAGTEPPPRKRAARPRAARAEVAPQAEPLPAASSPVAAVAEAAPSPQATVVFDLDDTLVRGDIGRAFIGSLLRRNPLRMLVALVLAPALLPLLRIWWSRRFAISCFLWIGSVGLRAEKWEALLSALISRYPLVPVRSAVEALREEISRGHQVVVATGAMRALALGLMARLDLPDSVRLVASDVRRFAGGWTVAWQNNGRIKLQRLLAEGFAGPYLRAYSDNAADQWLLAASQTPVLVNPNNTDRLRLRKRLGQKMRVVFWD